jgi:Na+/H+ antiporter NhaD/arsenite permease-like protein
MKIKPSLRAEQSNPSFFKLVCHVLGKSILAVTLLFFTIFTTPAQASSILPGKSLSLWWGIPFAGMLLSLAVLPLFALHFWEKHYGKVALGWSFLIILSLVGAFGGQLAGQEIAATLLHHYLPFVIMIGSLYTISGGIKIDVEAHATPLVNTTLLAVGTGLAGWIGTTGASMLLIRPLLHINRNRKSQVHQIIFFIFLVANIGGALTPLGDPPLFIGFLNGVSFFWPLQNLTFEMVLMAVPLLGFFYLFDTYHTKKEGLTFHKSRPKVRIQGKGNGILFLGVISLVLMSGVWKPMVSFDVGGLHLELQNMMRDMGLIFLGILSYFLTSKEIHRANHFSWEPLQEVAKLFFGIFVTVIPVITILDAGLEGALAPLVSLVTVQGQPQNGTYFWLSGGLSSILDNAPTYLVFFHMAGGNAEQLMTTSVKTLEAISLGSVFMGAMTYIGNAPNFMIKAIAGGRNIPMPSFFGYLLWSGGILLPLFILLSLLRY